MPSNNRAIIIGRFDGEVGRIVFMLSGVFYFGPEALRPLAKQIIKNLDI